MPNPLFVYAVIMNDDGSINIDTTVPEGLGVREATSLDILDTTRKINADLTHQRIVADVLGSVQAVTPTPADRIRTSLAQRAAEQAAQAATTDAQKDDPEV